MFVVDFIMHGECENHLEFFCDILTSAWKVGRNQMTKYQQTNISRALVGNKLADHSDVVGASPVGTAQTTSSFLT